MGGRCVCCCDCSGSDTVRSARVIGARSAARIRHYQHDATQLIGWRFADHQWCTSGALRPIVQTGHIKAASLVHIESSADTAFVAASRLSTTDSLLAPTPSRQTSARNLPLTADRHMAYKRLIQAERHRPCGRSNTCPPHSSSHRRLSNHQRSLTAPTLSFSSYLEIHLFSSCPTLRLRRPSALTATPRCTSHRASPAWTHGTHTWTSTSPNTRLHVPRLVSQLALAYIPGTAASHERDQTD